MKCPVDGKVCANGKCRAIGCIEQPEAIRRPIPARGLFRRLAALAFLLSVPLAIAAAADPVPAPIRGASVKVLVAGGHGSGVHIGGGYILTAAHVVERDFAKMTVRTDDGAEQPASLLLYDEIDDLAVLQIGNSVSVAEARLSCRSAALGEDVQAIGNPADLDFIHTFGRVVGVARKAGHWPAVFVIDAAVYSGMSGGPVLAANGDVIGVTVGMLGSTTITGSVAPFGFAFAVPSSVACRLLGRA